MNHQKKRRIAVLSLGTAVPAYSADQESTYRWMAESFAGQPALQRWLRTLYAHSGIKKRYTCVPDFIRPTEESRLAPGRELAEVMTTAERMDIYERESVTLAAAAGRQALARYGETAGQDWTAVAQRVTHLIVVTCTGFFAPGLDIALTRELGLGSNVERTIVGFMGCSAAFNGLRIAAQIVRGQPAARVLVVCVELCSLHIQPGTKRENLISASLFADGAAAGLVGEAQPGQGDLFEIGGFHTGIKPETGSEMVWQIGNHGFALRLSPQIPEHLAEAAPAALSGLMGEQSWPGFWAIHPGGRAIVDRLAEIFELKPEDVAASRSVLRHFGNLSSATILFVLDEIRQQLSQVRPVAGRTEGVAMAFGPGLVIEMARLVYVPARVGIEANGRHKTEMPDHVELA